MNVTSGRIIRWLLISDPDQLKIIRSDPIRRIPTPNQNSVHVRENRDLTRINCLVNYVPDKYTSPAYCKIVHLSDNLNFSILLLKKDGPTPISSLLMGDSLASNINLLTTRHNYVEPFSVELDYIKFSVISQYPRALEGMNAFLLPLSGPVWV